MGTRALWLSGEEIPTVPAEVPSALPVLGDMTPSSGLHGHCMHAVYIPTYRKPLKYIKISKSF